MTRIFEVGTLVMLKSGGPAMVVTSLREQDGGIVSVEWFADSGLHRDAFDAVNLTTAIVPQIAPYVSSPLENLRYPSVLSGPANMHGAGNL